MTQSADLTLGAISNLIQQKELSVTEVVNNYLDRIKQFESTLKAWVAVDEENALAKARVLDKAVRGDNNRSLLHGIPFGVKDIFWVKDSVTSAVSPIYRDFVPRQHATVVGNLLSAGAIFLVKTVTTEFATGDPPPTVNPWNPLHTPGGSSSGSAVAVSTGMCSFALGSQTSGSVLRPASYNGIVGFKPTFGLLSKFAMFSASWSMDTVGVLCRSVQDSSCAFHSMASHDQRDPSSSSKHVTLAGKDITDPDTLRPRLGVVKGMFKDASDHIAWANFESVVQKAANNGATVIEFDPSDIFERARTAQYIIQRSEFASYQEENYNKWSHLYSPVSRSWVEHGKVFTGVDYINAQRIRSLFIEELRSFLSQVDVLLTPSTPAAAPKDLSKTGNPLFQGLWTLSGAPAISIPSGLSDQGMPLGLQILGNWYDENQLLVIARWFEELLGLYLIPPLVVRKTNEGA